MCHDFKGGMMSVATQSRFIYNVPMTNQIVLSKKNNVYADSRVVAEKFGKRHQTVVRSIERLIKEYEDFSNTSGVPNTIASTDEYKGQKYTYYQMDRRFFSLLAMRFKGKKAFEWQIKFNDAFYAMEKSLVQLAQNQQSEMWLAQREQAKLIRQEETDIIKDFVAYATAQGSTKAQFYYKHITMAVYKCLGLIQYKHPKLRETLDMMQTSQLILAEMVARKSLEKYMANGENYRVVFVLVKGDLEAFASSFLV